MTSAELAIVAAFGASALTAAASLGVVWLWEWLSGRAAGRDALLAAVTVMLSRSMAVMSRAQAMGLQMRLHSGLGEGADVALRLRKPPDALELHDWMAADMGPQNEAWSVIWARGDQETVRLANALLAACGEVITAATATKPADGAAWLRRLLAGEKWTPEMQEGLDRAVREVAHARERLAQHVRAKLGLSAVTLFGHEPVKDNHAATRPGSERPDVPDAAAAAEGDGSGPASQ
jgi:hypothetical protein